MDSSEFFNTVKQRTEQIEIQANQSLSTNNKVLAFQSKIQLMEIMREIAQQGWTSRDLLLLQTRIMKLDTKLTEGIANFLFWKLS